MIYNETIVAQVTCPGKSAVGILRISGVEAKTVAMKILGKIPLARFATYSNFLDKNLKVLDKGISLWFPAPYSLTGEDVLELQGHGSPLIIDLLIKRILSIKNVRMAKPGEFSERAFLNGKIDLIQAESIDDLINSETELSIRASLNSLQGNFSFFIKELINLIIEFRINIESSIDFSEEEIDINIKDIVNVKFGELDNKFLQLKNMILEGSLLKEGKKIVIAGLPNAGKSSLLNILSYSDRAIVTDVPGTTRDVLYENISINGIYCELIDTAGLRKTDNKVERIGIIRAWEAIKKSDHILFVIDKTIDKLKQKKICDEFMKRIAKNKIPVTFILNKNDLVNDSFGIKNIDGLSFISISARTGEGINILREHIIKIEKNINKEGIFIARRRHINQIDLAYNEFLVAKNNWRMSENIEFLAESLNFINKILGEITGRYTSSDLLNHIFSSFCIGK
ncbi:tRNA uridine-5-carboxymethylaminomethyl(34) synthesis GTPase MnmE [Buchnera aphidicola (Acyrthosiphon lactucae)]|uniref:tRNA modification GTPase MnmE n=1 Tax=Buchnera aphidicola (Acyrthosiphon lactucae) TaxID=1241832 RepID=A0A4D6XL32_9GAMM|nr:tRNA uridine-5-carboxymethylaminomethyl(34) synthesis GTPase MnmE [Buchnera aphidicola]QCI17442.1 tRNA uridine-5-carboxymethylaminomethyl(34) synthesis GTPase MnmE [Buchnera aphidicola (Acyrthosiphon lactucae)]